MRPVEQALRDAHVLVTGGAGFIGSHVVALLERLAGLSVLHAPMSLPSPYAASKSLAQAA